MSLLYAKVYAVCSRSYVSLLALSDGIAKYAMILFKGNLADEIIPS